MKKAREIELSEKNENLWIRICASASILEILVEDTVDCLKTEEYRKAMWCDQDTFANRGEIIFLGTINDQLAAKFWCATMLIRRITEIMDAIENSYNSYNEIDRQIEPILSRLQTKQRMLELLCEEIFYSMTSKIIRWEKIIVIYYDEFRVYYPRSRQC